MGGFMLKHRHVIEQMTLDEKCFILSGKDFWNTRGIEHAGIPQMMMSDGPHGVRKQEGSGDQLGLGNSVPATCFPTAATMANSWDPALGEELGAYLGEEAAAQGVCMLLGPGLNIKRSPLCGRNFEYFSEDPYLAGKMAASYVRGIQSKGISACPKHFAANNTELRRQSSDSVVDERTLREIYLTGFEIVVREAHPKGIMSSYNMVNGTYANENEWLLDKVLRDEWGFDGCVVTDWGGGNDFVEGVRAGSNLEMPTCGGDSGEQLVAAVRAGKISEDLVDERVDELLDVVFSTCAARDAAAGTSFDVDAHHAMALKASEQSIVLLKNDDAILPLAPGTKVAVIGEFAKKARYQGAGSSVVNCTKLDNTMDVIGNFDIDVAGFEPGYPRHGAPDPAMRETAVRLATQADYVLLYLGLDEISESEGLDRSSMAIPTAQVELLDAVSAVNPNVIVVLSAGSAVEMPWLDKCKALVHGYLCGQAGASAVLEVIMGQVNPSGKLSETYPLHYEDEPSAPYFPAKERSVEYREGLFVGYRYFETAGVDVLFPFGFGMSYTAFDYADLKVADDLSRVTFTISNTGQCAGAEVAQLYVSAKGGDVFRPAIELKGFTKVFLEAGESCEAEIELDDKAFRYFNVKTDKFEVESGDYEILIGASSKDIRLRHTVTVKGTDAPAPYDAALPSYATGDIKAVGDDEFAALLGRAVPDGSWSGSLQMNDAICQMYYAKSRLARFAYNVMTKRLNKSIEAGAPDLNITFVYNMPFRAIGKMAGGMISQEMCEALVSFVNGCGGLGRFIGGFFRQRKRNKRADAIR